MAETLVKTNQCAGHPAVPRAWRRSTWATARGPRTSSRTCVGPMGARHAIAGVAGGCARGERPARRGREDRSRRPRLGLHGSPRRVLARRRRGTARTSGRRRQVAALSRGHRVSLLSMGGARLAARPDSVRRGVSGVPDHAARRLRARARATRPSANALTRPSAAHVQPYAAGRGGVLSLMSYSLPDTCICVETSSPSPDSLAA